MKVTSLAVVAGVAFAAAGTSVCAQSAFDGAYFGFGLGAGRGETARTGAVLEMPDQSGAIAHGVLGFAASSGALVYGVEADAALADVDGQGLCNARPCSAEIDALASVRARAGVVAADTLFFATAGLATARVDLTAQDSLGGGHSDDDWVQGWVAGVGVERPMASGWNLRGEVLRHEFRAADYDLDVPYADMETDMTSARVSLTRRF